MLTEARADMDPMDRAEALFSASHNCAQAVFGALCAGLGLESDIAVRIASGFGGGMRCGEVCGAVAGALMALGLSCSDGTPDTKAHANQAAADFMQAFRSRHGSYLCRELLGYDISTPEGRERMARNKGHDPACAAYVRDAVMLACEGIEV